MAKKERVIAETAADNPRQNRILAALSVSEYARLADDLELVELTQGQCLFQSGDCLDFVYFPTTCIASLVFSSADGASTELAMTGNDGLACVPLILGGQTTTHAVMVQHAGKAYRLRAGVMRWELDQGGNLLRLSLAYAQALMTQMAQSVVCNRHHAVEQQLCRWLLLSLDQLPGNQIEMTQELIAGMLGVRRESITEAASQLQASGLIEYRRGHITVTNRPGLEARVCECYRLVKREYERLFLIRPDELPKDRARPNPATLRSRATTRLKQLEPILQPVSWEKERLLQELQLHQIELEMHIEELHQAYDEADRMREKCADIYDFAPIGYFTLNTLGAIIQLNLAGAIMLGIKRSEHVRHRFAASVKPEYQAVFNTFHQDVLQARGKLKCELGMIANPHGPETMVRIEAVPDETGRECRMVVIDITTERQAAKALKEWEHVQRTLLDHRL